MQGDDATGRVRIGRKAHRLEISRAEDITEENLTALVIADALQVWGNVSDDVVLIRRRVVLVIKHPHILRRVDQRERPVSHVGFSERDRRRGNGDSVSVGIGPGSGGGADRDDRADSNRRILRRGRVRVDIRSNSGGGRR